MAYFTLSNLGGVQTALDTLTVLQGAYQAVDILKGTFKDVEEPDEFAKEVRVAEAKVGRSYQTPAGTDHAILTALKTAARLEGDKQSVVIELLAMVILRLGAAQGSRVVALMLAACGMDPTLALVVVKVCILLAGTDAGRKIVVGAEPGLREISHYCANPSHLLPQIQSLAGQLGDQGAQMLASAKETTANLKQQGLETFDSLLDSLSDP